MLSDVTSSVHVQLALACPMKFSVSFELLGFMPMIVVWEVGGLFQSCCVDWALQICRTWPIIFINENLRIKRKWELNLENT